MSFMCGYQGLARSFADPLAHLRSSWSATRSVAWPFYACRWVLPTLAASVNENGIFRQNYIFIFVMLMWFYFLPSQSKEQRYVLLTCMATVGEVSNPEHKNQTLGKAGRSRWMGRKPKVRGVAMNPVDHPNGGGEGKKSGKGLSPWGLHSKGFKTVRKLRPFIKLPRWKARKSA